MKRERVVVTGANGYIGRHVVKKLLDMNYEVIASDLRTDFIDDRAIIVTDSIFEEDIDVFQNLKGADRCIHLAWRDGFQHNSNAHMEDLSKHYTFVRKMIEGGVKSISVMGSMHEVGYWEGAVDENTPTNPLSMYGIAKNSLREATTLLAASSNVSLKWLRGYYILGDDASNHSIFTKIIEKAQAGEKKFPFTSGKNKYDFTDVDDLATQIVLSSVQDEIEGVINCCSGQPVSLGEKVEWFIEKSGFDIELEYGAFPDRKYDSPGIWGDNQKISAIIKNSAR